MAKWKYPLQNCQLDDYSMSTAGDQWCKFDFLKPKQILSWVWPLLLLFLLKQGYWYRLSAIFFFPSHIVWSKGTQAGKMIWPLPHHSDHIPTAELRLGEQNPITLSKDHITCCWSTSRPCLHCQPGTGCWAMLGPRNCDFGNSWLA